METLLEPQTRRYSRVSDHQNNGHYVNIDGNSEKVYTVDEVFSRLENNLNSFYGTNYKLK